MKPAFLADWKRPLRRCGAVALSVFALAANLFAKDELLPQRLLYIGHRESAFVPFLKEHFASVEAVTRDQFQPAQAKAFDVVLLDWPQSGGLDGEWLKGAPLGKREEWHKPTVLLGSAGLNLAVTWKLKGGSGCTCLAPVAYDLREHEIFRTPVPINLKATTKIPTPEQFANEIKEEEIEVLPLVNHIQNFRTVINDYPRGWSTHYFEFADMPEVEVFSGGINEQYPRSAAFWRQGNLLHFGFDQPPGLMNEVGRAMLINAVVYISRFNQDQPIDITPSVFAKEQIGISRRRAKKYLTIPDYLKEAKNDFSAATLASFNVKDPEAVKAWLDANGQWLHPGAGNLLEVDSEAKSLGTPFDAADFIPKTIRALREEKTKSTAATLLGRYVNEGPGANARVEDWEKWWQENSAYVFYSELGCYRWYIDPLAKKRGIPTKDLRGPKRADVKH